MPAREENFISFLTKTIYKTDRLYLLGDIFEFGFVFRGRILHQYQSLVDAISRITRQGTVVYFLGGNHDLWMSDYLRARGVRILREGDVHSCNGRSIQFFHGILIQPDTLSRFAERLMLNPDAVWLYSMIPPAPGFRTALKAAGLSRKRHKPFPSKIARNQLKSFSPDANLILTGHHHDAIRFDFNQWEVLSVGNFFRDYTYLELTDSGLKRKAFSVDSFLGG